MFSKVVNFSLRKTPGPSSSLRFGSDSGQLGPGRDLDVWYDSPLGSGFVVFDSFTGETRFSLTLSEQKLSEADLEAIDC